MYNFGYLIYRKLLSGKKPGLREIQRYRAKLTWTHCLHAVFQGSCGIDDLSLVKRCIDLGACPSKYDYGVLWWACKKGSLRVFKYLLSLGYYPPNSHVILEASEAGHLAIVKLLVKLGYDPTYLENAPIIRASMNGHLSVVKYLWNIGCNPKDGQFWGWNIIEWASSNGHLSVVKFLVQVGYDAIEMSFGLACCGGHLHVVRFLYKIGCDPTGNNNEAMRVACYFGNLSIVKYLVKIGCDPTVDNNVAIEIANKHKYFHIVGFLKSRGCILSN